MKSKKDIFLTHFKGLFIKRYHYSKRDKKGILCEIIVPIIMVIIGLSIMTISFLKESGALIMEPSMYDFSPLPVTYGGDVNETMASNIM